MGIQFILFILLNLFLPTKQSQSIDKEDISFLELKAEEYIKGCVIQSNSGINLYTPDGKGNYKALWTRDFSYMVRYAGQYIPDSDLKACIEYLIQGQRADGSMPDRVQPDGIPVYAGGGIHSPLGEPNLDNGPFMVLLVEDYLKRLPSDAAIKQFETWSDALKKGLDYLPKSKNGLLYNSPEKPHSPYGFTDTVGKTGYLFMESLLYWQACKAMETLYNKVENIEKRDKFVQQSQKIEQSVSTLWNPSDGAFYAASIDCKQIDIWGNIYGLYINFPFNSTQKKAMERFLVSNYSRYVQAGQVRHLLVGEYWNRLLLPINKDSYQNGAYWATPSGWLIKVMATVNPELSKRTAIELIRYFRENSIYECFFGDDKKLDTYVVSATNPLYEIKQLSK